VLSLIHQQAFESESWLSATALSWLKNPGLNPLLGTQEFPFDLLEKQAAQRLKSYPPERREALLKALEKQYTASGIDFRAAGVDLLADKRSVVVTTAHQPNWLGGPSYWLHKMLSTVALARAMQAACPAYRWIPVYWMGSEDHDLEELGVCEVNGRRLEWPGPRGPYAFGRLEVPSMEDTLDLLRESLGDAPLAEHVIGLVRESYREGQSVAEATRRLAHSLLGRGGWLDQVNPLDTPLLVVDGDDVDLKILLGSVWEDQVTHPGLAADLVEQAQKEWEQRSGSRVDFRVRDLPFFVLDGKKRVRPDQNSDLELFRSADWVNFSPGAALRPLYQESVLPGVAWLGGGAEQGYWAMLQPLFERYGVDMPLRFLRPSLTTLTKSDWLSWQAMGWKEVDLGRNGQVLLDEWLNHRMQERAHPLPEWLSHSETIQSRVEEILNPVRKALVESDASLGPALGAAAHRIQQELERLAQMDRKSFRKKHRNTLDEAGHLLERIRPGGQPIERKEGMWNVLALGGASFLSDALELLSPVDFDGTNGNPWHRTAVLTAGLDPNR